jgi:hypothetical protein
MLFIEPISQRLRYNAPMNIERIKHIADWVIKFAEVGIAGFGVFVGWQGLRTWREQLHGKEEFELARNIARAIHNLFDTVQGVRSDGLFFDSLPAARKRIGKAMTELAALTVEGEIFWGKATVKPLVDILNFPRHYLLICGKYFRAMDMENPPKQPHGMNEFAKCQAVVSMDEENDTFGKEFSEAVEKCIEVVRPYLPRR